MYLIPHIICLRYSALPEEEWTTGCLLPGQIDHLARFVAPHLPSDAFAWTLIVRETARIGLSTTITILQRTAEHFFEIGFFLSDILLSTPCPALSPLRTNAKATPP